MWVFSTKTSHLHNKLACHTACTVNMKLGIYYMVILKGLCRSELNTLENLSLMHTH